MKLVCAVARAGGRLVPAVVLSVVLAGASLPVGAVQGDVAAPEGTVVDCDRGDELQAAITAAVAGRAVWFAGTCRGNFDVAGSVALRGLPGATLSAAGVGTALTIGADAEVSVTMVTIIGGAGTLIGSKPATQIGGAVVNHGSLQLRDVTVRGATLTANAVAEVGAAQGGGIWNDGFLLLQRTTVTANEARALVDEGGGVYNAGRAEFVDSAVTANVAAGLAGRGGGIFNAVGASLALRRTRLDANTASGRTGGGGGLYNAGTTSVDGGTIVANTVGGLAVAGGGVANDAVLALRRVEVASNKIAGSVGVAGGGLANRGSATLERVWLTDNSAAGTVQPAIGGGVAGLAGTLVIRRSIVAKNTPTDCWPAELCGELTEAGG